MTEINYPILFEKKNISKVKNVILSREKVKVYHCRRNKLVEKNLLMSKDQNITNFF